MTLASLLLLCSLFSSFQDPPHESRPWCYWLWRNTTVDRACITADLENIRDLGFGGILFSDTRGYGETRVITPVESTPVFSEQWYGLFEFALREAARLGLEFTMNISSSGGTLKGPWPVGEDAPMRLVAGIGVETPPASFTNYQRLAVFDVKLADGVGVTNGWVDAGGATGRWQRDYADVFREAVDWREIADNAAKPAAGWVRVTFGRAMIPNRECDVDVLDASAVERHFYRLAGPIFKRAGDLVGKTLTHFYSVSWEGAVPTWTKDFERAFEEHVGYAIRPYLPALAGFAKPGTRSAEQVLKDYRTVRNDLFRENFYGKFRELCHRHGMKMFSESGGPWNRGESVFRHADQLEFLAVNDMPQGESWVFVPSHHTGPHHNRPAAACARLYGKPRASCESFTHMDFHWSVPLALIKGRADEEFADGINLIVWHTYTASPRSQGIPGLEYFAGTHLNRHVTWNREASATVRYLARCQHLLQWGTAVMDLAVYGGDEIYTHWDPATDRTQPWTNAGFRIPPGYTYDVVNRDVMERLAKRDGEGLTMPCGTRYRYFLDAAKEPVILPKLPVRDCEGAFRAVHRTDGKTDIYFLTGEGAAEVTLAVDVGRRSVELWHPLDGTRQAAEWRATDDGRTRVKVELPQDGSVFVVIGENGGAPDDPFRHAAFASVIGPWQVSFAYPDGITAEPPKSTVWTELHDWTTDRERDVKDFAGMVTYRTHFCVQTGERTKLLLTELLNAVAHVFVNGKDCGVAWCPPWEVDVTDALKDGEKNELEIRVTNNWHNRLIADTKLPAGKRVTTSCLHYYPDKGLSQHWTRRCSGYCRGDVRQPSGLIGPVVLMTGKTRKE